MPFDQVNFTLPAVETDEVLRELIAARSRIEHPDRWTQGHCYYEGARCAIGAVYEATQSWVGRVPADARTPAREEAMALLAPAHTRLSMSCAHLWISSFNDTHTHADVLALFDRAIAARRAEIGSA